MTSETARASTTADVISALVLMVTVAGGVTALVAVWPTVDVLRGGAMALGCLASALAGGWDLRQRRVPNALTLPLIVIALTLAGTRVALRQWGPAELGALALTLTVCLAAWVLGLFGGGDSKLAMGLLGLFPTTAFALGILVGLLVGGLVYVAFAPDRGGWSRLNRVVTMVLARRALPTREDVAQSYRRRANPAAAWIGAGFCVSATLSVLQVMS